MSDTHETLCIVRACDDASEHPEQAGVAAALVDALRGRLDEARYADIRLSVEYPTRDEETP